MKHHTPVRVAASLLACAALLAYAPARAAGVTSAAPSTSASSDSAGKSAAPQVWERWRPEDGDLTEALTWKRKVKSGVTVDQVEGALESVAIEQNFKSVGAQPLSKELEARTGKKQPFLKIYSYCSPTIAAEMVAFNPAFAAFLPCRIALLEKPDGLWLYTFNMDVILKSGTGKSLPPELAKDATAVRSIVLQMLDRGAKGDF